MLDTPFFFSLLGVNVAENCIPNLQVSKGQERAIENPSRINKAWQVLLYVYFVILNQNNKSGQCE